MKRDRRLLSKRHSKKVSEKTRSRSFRQGTVSSGLAGCCLRPCHGHCEAANKPGSGRVFHVVRDPARIGGFT